MAFRELLARYLVEPRRQRGRSPEGLLHFIEAQGVIALLHDPRPAQGAVGIRQRAMGRVLDDGKRRTASLMTLGYFILRPAAGGPAREPVRRLKACPTVGEGVQQGGVLAFQLIGR